MYHPYALVSISRSSIFVIYVGGASVLLYLSITSSVFNPQKKKRSTQQAHTEQRKAPSW